MNVETSKMNVEDIRNLLVVEHGYTPEQVAEFKGKAKLVSILHGCTKKSELADSLDLPAEKVADTLRVSGRHISVDAPFVEGEDNSLLDVLVNDDSPIADRSLINESLATEIERALSTLTERERDIIRLFFGIGCQDMTLEEIGEQFGLTRERVRQIKEKAIRRLRHTSRSKLLKTFLG